MLIAGPACVLFAAGLTGCSAEMAGTSGIPANKPVSVTIMLAPEKTEIATATKAGDTPEITADGKINALDIYIIDNEGKVEKHVTESDFTSPGSDDGKATTSSPVELLPGTKTVYAFANCRGSNFSALGLSSGSGGWTAVPEAVSNNAAFNVIPEITTSNGIPMSASTTWEVTEATETTYAIELVRMAAKMEIRIEDKREDQSKKITSLTIKDFLPANTHLFRTATGKDTPTTGTPAPADWKWERTAGNTDAPSIAPFYLHEIIETTGAFDVSMQIEDETTPRTTTLSQLIPRNRIYPLTIHLTDYSLAISGTYHLAAIGTVAVSKNIGNGYTIELPEGSSDIEIRIQLKENGTEKDSDVTWSCSSIPDYFTCNPLGADATLVLSSEAIPATVIEEQTVTVSAEFTKNGSKQTRSFSLIIQVSPLTDDDLTKAVSGHFFGTPQTIHIEL
ncbi:MAG: fimbrial protein [Parabacteroides gordonii]|nr:fimbrial protein [Parabacteroides gordonii]